MNRTDRLPPRPGDRELESPPSSVQIALMGTAPSVSAGFHWSECIVVDPRPPQPEAKSQSEPMVQQTKTARPVTGLARLNKQADRIFRRIIAHGRLDNGGSGIMAVGVDRLSDNDYGTIWAISHYWKHDSGDMMADPDMTFLVATDGVYPMTFQQDPGIYQEAVVWAEDGSISGYRRRQQRELKDFANRWMQNIEAQQFSKGGAA